MTPLEFKRWREHLGLSQQQAGESLGATKRAVQLWEAGDRPISRTVALACAAVSAGLKPEGEAA